MKFPGLGWLKRKQGAAPQEGQALVLMYHRVARPATDPWALSVTPQHFEEHLQVLRRLVHPVKVRELTDSLSRGWKGHLAVVTFDDGYSDNFHTAKPLLERYDVPATVFLATSFLGSNREFWWDELDRLFLQPGALPAVLDFEWSGTPRTWDLGDAADYPSSEFERCRGWRAEEPPPTMRQKLYRSVWQSMQRMSAPEQQAVTARILSWANATTASRAGYRPMTLEEAAQMARCRLIELGAHTATHPVLSSLPASHQREEIESSTKQVEEILGGRVRSFAFPYGDHNSESDAILRENRFTGACTTVPGAIRKGSLPLCLPRIHVPDWSGEEFETNLTAWFAA